MRFHTHACKRHVQRQKLSHSPATYWGHSEMRPEQSNSPLDDLSNLGLPVGHRLLFISQVPHLFFQLPIAHTQPLKHGGELNENWNNLLKVYAAVTSSLCRLKATSSPLPTSCICFNNWYYPHTINATQQKSESLLMYDLSCTERPFKRPVLHFYPNKFISFLRISLQTPLQLLEGVCFALRECGMFYI